MTALEVTAAAPAPPVGRSSWAWLVVLSVGAALMTLRVVDGPIAQWLAAHASLETLPEASLGRVDDLLLVPAASVLVVFCRVTLGLRMLGPFRPILIGLALYQTGTLTGVVFLLFVLSVVVLVRPRLRTGLLPYFGRLGTLLSLVVLFEIAMLLVGAGIGSDELLRVAVFPIVVLCLCVDGFARVLSKQGLVPAAWRVFVTIAIAVVVAQFGTVESFANFLFAFPEFVLVEIGVIMCISTRMNWQLLRKYLPQEVATSED